MAGQAGVDQDARADGTGVRQSQQLRGFSFGAVFYARGLTCGAA